MSHSENTAATYYQHIGQAEQRIKAYNAISSIRKRNRISLSEDEQGEPEPQPARTKVKRVKFTVEEVGAMKTSHTKDLGLGLVHLSALFN